MLFDTQSENNFVAMVRGVSPQNTILYIVFYSRLKSLLHVVAIFFCLYINLCMIFVDESLLKRLYPSSSAYVHILNSNHDIYVVVPYVGENIL